ncbi:MAG: hypothetical protein KJP23_09545 [Deltaproteobacteria bacterium]|nr:hypothetical protein [Deltaproteobacteria bacterium]
MSETTETLYLGTNQVVIEGQHRSKKVDFISDSDTGGPHFVADTLTPETYTRRVTAISHFTPLGFRQSLALWARILH